MTLARARSCSRPAASVSCRSHGIRSRELSRTKGRLATVASNWRPTDLVNVNARAEGCNSLPSAFKRPLCQAKFPLARRTASHGRGTHNTSGSSRGVIRVKLFTTRHPSARGIIPYISLFQQTRQKGNCCKGPTVISDLLANALNILTLPVSSGEKEDQ